MIFNKIIFEVLWVTGSGSVKLSHGPEDSSLYKSKINSDKPISARCAAMIHPVLFSLVSDPVPLQFYLLDPDPDPGVQIALKF